MYLDSIRLLVNQFFPKDWHNKYSFDNPGGLEIAKVEFDLCINKLSQAIFECINRSLLAGEYLLLLDDDKNFLNALAPVLEVPLDYIPEDYRQSFELRMFNKILTPTIHVWRCYKAMLKRVRRKLSFDNKWILSTGKIDIMSLLPEMSDLDNDTKEEIKVLYINARLCEIDHSISADSEIQVELVKLKYILSEELQSSIVKNKDYVKILIDKCNFLLKKVLYRLSENPKEYVFIHDFRDEELNFEKLNVEYYTYFDELYTSFGDNNKISPKTLAAIDEIRDRELREEKLSFRDYYCATKHYKDIEPSILSLEKLSIKHDNEFKSERPSSKFDLYAYCVTQNYLKNNELSYLLNDGADLKDIEIKMIEILEVQQKTGIRNYFPFKRYSVYLEAKIDELVRESDPDLSEIRTLLSKFEKYLEITKRNFSWCKEKKFLAFQLLYESCLQRNVKVSSTTADYTLFLASSFVLPLNFQVIEQKIDKLSKSLERFKSFMIFHEILMSQKNALESLKGEIKTYDKRSIEILGIFSAIILFGSGSLNLLQGNKPLSVNDALLFMVAFASALCLFIFLLWIITLDPSRKLRRIQYLAVGGFLGLLLVTVLKLLNIFTFKI